jgi:hypothetical protein
MHWQVSTATVLPGDVVLIDTNPGYRGQTNCRPTISRRRLKHHLATGSGSTHERSSVA